MKRITLTVRDQSLTFTEGELGAIIAALEAAERQPGVPAFRESGGGRISATLYQGSGTAQRLTDRNRRLTDC
ncbi:MAG: hypothetical protein V4812_14210 [Pseudomonadota bacterium]